MKYKLVAIDMDGTLLNSKNQVSEKTKETIVKAKGKGAYIVLSTGRVLKSALSYSRDLDLRNPIIACNGAIIADENGNIIYKNPIDNNLVKEIVNLARSKNIYYHFYDENRFYSHIRVDEILKFYSEGDDNNRIDIKIFKNLEEITSMKDLNVYKFLFIDDDKNKLQKLRDELNGLNNIETSSSWANNIEAMGLNVSKGEGLRELCSNLKIAPDEVIAIGDNENDLSMIKFAGLGVAMGNGDESIKKQADYITDSNDEDGVAKIIEKFVLE
ncbi:Cof-type HAD-IIB family hydrolase [Tissierella sp.]|uniref:Cof-type HAD-IIB family hydrolase n=1 Tax=Tissierella sp. TaxID=41274 RepID=UPI0028AA671F|nr:Cof-type HAD-IIB family hydrolase [Tissierella sp.]